MDPNRNPPPIGPLFARAARRLAVDCKVEASSDAVEALVVPGSALSIPLPNESVDAVISSPPYYVTYDYINVQRLTYLTFRWQSSPAEQVGRRYRVSPDGVGFSPPKSMEDWYYRIYRGETTFLGRALRAYLRDLESHFAEVHRVLAPGGVVGYAVGNSTRAGRVFNLATAIGELLTDAGFASVEIHAREQVPRRILPAGRDTATGRFSSDTRLGVAEHIVWATRRGPRAPAPPGAS